jgi:hypothetical protein
MDGIRDMDRTHDDNAGVDMAIQVIKFSQFGTLPSGYTAVLNISGSYEVPV